MFSGLWRRDLFKGTWSLRKNFFQQNYCQACHPKFAKFFKCFRPIGQWEDSPHPWSYARLRGHVLSGGRGGGDVALNSLLRGCNLSLKLPLSCRALKQLEITKLRVSFWWTWIFLCLSDRNQEESHHRRLMVKSWVSLQYLLYLSQVKLCGLELPAGAVFINSARYTCYFAKISYNLLFKPIRRIVETIVKLTPFCFPTCSLRLVLSF